MKQYLILFLIFSNFFITNSIKFKSSSRLEIKKGITGICAGAFSDMSGLTYAYLPNTIQEVGDSAFATPSLEEVVFEQGFFGQFDGYTALQHWVSTCFRDSAWLGNIGTTDPSSYTSHGSWGEVAVEIYGTLWHFELWVD